MKIQLVSDLHLEFLSDYGKAMAESFDPTDVDVLVIAGDLIPMYLEKAAEAFLTTVCGKYKHVVYVPGNHEYYKSSPKQVRDTLDRIKKKCINLYELGQHGVLTYEGSEYRFIGGTLWFPDHPKNVLYQKYMCDFRVIKDFNPWVYEQNAAEVNNLEKNLQAGDIVVTHHMPSDLSVHQMYKNNELNRFFVCDMDYLILDRKPKLWLHGHTHHSFDYMLGDTRVVCNPKGYPHESGPTFNARLIIEV